MKKLEFFFTILVKIRFFTMHLSELIRWRIKGKGLMLYNNKFLIDKCFSFILIICFILKKVCISLRTLSLRNSFNGDDY